MEKKQLIENRALEVCKIKMKNTNGLIFDENKSKRESFKAGADFALTLFPKWRRIDPQNLPNGEVLAMSIYSETKMFGTLEDSEKGIVCRMGEYYSINPTHYLPISELLNLEKEN